MGVSSCAPCTRRPSTRLPHQQQLLWNRGVAFAATKAPEHVDTGLLHQGFAAGEMGFAEKILNSARRLGVLAVL
jgi:hypothetical protein